LGSGGKKLPGYINVDCTASENPDVVWDLERVRWPWEDNSVDSVEAWHILEHIGDGFFFFLQELYRVCKPGARIGVIVPHPRHDVFLNDPTHKRVVTPDGMAMFSRKHCEEQERRGGRLTPFWQYIGVNFDLEGPIQMILDPSVKKDDDWKEMERRMNNVVVEYWFALRVVK
jgi:hypothetical protein